MNESTNFTTQDDHLNVQFDELLKSNSAVPDGEMRAHKRLRYRLNEYGNRVLASGSKFLQATQEALSNIGTALAGSIILLPLVIVARGVSVLSHGLLDLIKPLILSTIRLFFETLHAVIAPVRTAFGNFNKYTLFPLLKRIREDDAAALVAFVVLIAMAALVVFLLSVLF